MERAIGRRGYIMALVFLAGLALVLTGCSSTVSERRTDSPEVREMGAGRYYFFEDVLVPKELNYQPDESFVYETPQFKAGSMVFTKWWLDVGSIYDFFAYYMEKDNWQLLNSFRGKESILNFSKPDKTCTIKITDKWTGTAVVEIRVGPVGMRRM